MFLSLRKRNDESLPLLRTGRNAINGQRDERGIPRSWEKLPLRAGWISRAIRSLIDSVPSRILDRKEINALSKGN